MGYSQLRMLWGDKAPTCKIILDNKTKADYSYYVDYKYYERWCDGKKESNQSKEKNNRGDDS